MKDEVVCYVVTDNMPVAMAMAKTVSTCAGLQARVETVNGLAGVEVSSLRSVIGVYQEGWDELRLAFLRGGFSGQAVISCGCPIAPGVAQPKDCHQLTWPPVLSNILSKISDLRAAYPVGGHKEPMVEGFAAKSLPESLSPSQLLMDLNARRLSDLAMLHSECLVATEIAAARAAFGAQLTRNDDLRGLEEWLSIQPLDALLRRPPFAEWRQVVSSSAHTLKHILRYAISFQGDRKISRWHANRMDHGLWTEFVKCCFSLPGEWVGANPELLSRLIEPNLFLLTAAWLADRAVLEESPSALLRGQLASFTEQLERLQRWDHDFNSINSLRILTMSSLDLKDKETFAI